MFSVLLEKSGCGLTIVSVDIKPAIAVSRGQYSLQWPFCKKKLKIDPPEYIIYWFPKSAHIRRSIRE